MLLHRQTLTRHGFGQGVHPLAEALEKQSEATLAWLRSLPPGGERDEVYELAASSAGDADVALELFAQLRPEASARAAYNIAKRFAGNSAVTQQWIDNLPSGPVRQQAFAGFGASGAISEPSRVDDRDAWLSGRIEATSNAVAALKQITQISDPMLRKDMFYEIFKSVRGTPEARNRIIDTLMDEAGLSEDWKRRLTE